MVDTVEKAVEQNVNVENPAVIQPEVQQEEKLLKQSEVNAIVGKAKKEAAEKATREAEAKYLEYQQQMQSQQQYSQALNMGAQYPQVTPEVAQAIQTQIQQQAIKMEQEKVARSFLNRIEAAREADPKLSEALDILDIRGTTPYAAAEIYNSFDNMTDVLHDIATRFPDRFTSINATAISNPKAARKAILELSNSIKQNKEAKKQEMPQEPQTKIKPSNVGLDNGVKNVVDYRKQSWLRG